MAKAMENYEAVMVLSTKQGEDAIKALVEKFSEIIKANATLESVDEWGKRTLAYEIDDETEGYYVLFNFNSVPSFPMELERRMNITDGILRSLVVTRV
ncbi:MAG TPA: 30S ribosomal protein S6 [Candidatus Merdivicinus excrementipullorum]|uniref:Small ribosomal subunit protein bS6 n=1 Tax=Candidatus Merdivicinus excrementipullorum TaxID=2840867 RepID=A0A9D1FPE5_9FIRM|nr:30S ribosomal protein S6 [Candidatus Merdivicinus excrementipullorum]